MPYVSGVLHADGVGVYSYTYTIATGFALFAALGVNTYGQRLHIIRIICMNEAELFGSLSY